SRPVCRDWRITGSAFVTMRLSIEIMNTAIQQARYVQSGFLIPTFSIPGPAQMVPASSGTALMWRWNRRLLRASPTTSAKGAPGVANHVLTSGGGSLLAALPRPGELDDCGSLPDLGCFPDAQS